MVALSRLKATFEACLGLFHQNMKTMGRKSRRGGMQKPRRRVRRTEPLPTMYSLQYTRWQKQLRTAENAWARAASVSVPYACRKSGPEASEKASLFGKWRWLGHVEEYIWTYVVFVRDVIHWFLHKFNVGLRWLCDTVQAFKATARLMCPAAATAPLLNPTPDPFTCLNSCGHSPVLMRTSSWMVWAGSCQPTLLVQNVFHSKLTEWQIWLPRKSSQVETEWGLSSTLGRCSECGSFLSSLLLRLLSEFSPYPGRAAFSGQQQAAFKIMWRSAWCFTTLIAETITLTDVFEFTTHNN